MLIYRASQTNTRHNGTRIYWPQFITMKREKLAEGLRGLALRKNREFEWNGRGEGRGKEKIRRVWKIMEERGEKKGRKRLLSLCARQLFQSVRVSNVS